MAAGVRTLKIRFDGDTKDLAAATKIAEQEVSKFSKSVAKSIEGSGDTGGKGFFGKVMSWVSQLGSGMTDAASSMGSGLAKGIQSNPYVGAAIAAAILTVAIVLMPAIGMALGGAMVLGFGAGIVGLGLVFAAQSDKIKSGFTALKDHIVSTMKAISKPLEPVWETILSAARRTFDFFSPLLAQAFKDLAPHLSSFFNNLFKGFESFGPALKPISDAFGALLDAIGPELPGWMKKISDSIISISNSVKDNPQGFSDMIGFFFDMTAFALGVVNALVKVYNWFTIDLPAALTVAKEWVVLKWNEMVDFLKGIGFAISELGRTQWQGVIDGLNTAKQWVIDRWNDITGFLAGVRDNVAGFGRSMWDGAKDGVNNAKQWIVDRWNDVVGFVTGLPGRISGAVSGMWDGIKNSFRSAVNWLIAKWNNFSLTIGGGSILGVSIPSVTLNTPDIPMLAKGGTAQANRTYMVGERGPELFTPGQTGRVTSNDQTFGGPSSIELHLDLGEGIAQVFDIQLDRSNRQTRRAVLSMAGGTVR